MTDKMLASVNFSLLLTFLIPYLTTAYRVRQNIGLAGYDDPYSLSNALGAIDLQRRQLNELSGPRFSDQVKEDYFYPREVRQRTPFVESPNLPAYAESYPYHIAERSRSWNSPQKRTAYHPHRVVPTVNELRELFGAANLPVKRLAPVKRRYFKTETVDETESEKTDIEDSDEDVSTDKDRLTDKLRKLIDAAEKIGNEQISTHTETITTDDGPVEEIKETEISDAEPLKDESGALTEKVVDVFENAMTDDGDESEDSSATGNDNDSDLAEEESDTDLSNVRTSELEELINDYLSKSQTKSKRASSTEASNVGTLLRQIAELKGRLSSVQILKALEDKENDYLARALKYATLDQLVGGEEFMTKEYEDIVKATETEELLQMLSPDLNEEDVTPVGDEATENLEPEDFEQELLKKRTDTDSEGWYDTPIREKVVGGAELHSLGQDKRGSGRPVMGSEFPIAVPYQDDSEEADDEIDDDFIDDDNNDDDETEIDQDEDNQLLEQILSGMSPEQLRNLVEDYSEIVEPDQDSGFCPAVYELTTNCAFIDQQGIRIDEEARNLCNRHEMCYKCGPDIGLSEERCDEGYKNTVLEECDGDVRCLRSAILFLKLMKDYHSYSLFGSPQCQQSCVERFIYEGE